MENFILNTKYFNKNVIRLPDTSPDSALFRGSNQKKILIVCQLQRNNQEIDESFLKKIFASVRIDLASDASLFLLPQSTSYNWNSLVSSVPFDTLIFFGTNFQSLGLQIEATAYTPLSFQKKVFLLTEPLNAIADDRGKKAALWNALKQLFDVK